MISLQKIGDSCMFGFFKKRNRIKYLISQLTIEYYFNRMPDLEFFYSMHQETLVIRFKKDTTIVRFNTRTEDYTLVSDFECPEISTFLYNKFRKVLIKTYHEIKKMEEILDNSKVSRLKFKTQEVTTLSEQLDKKA